MYTLIIRIISVFCVLCCEAGEIPHHVKLGYATKINEAFVWQSAGQSITAAAIFEEGFLSAMKAGESIQKLQPIRQMFVWYRTYGHYLGLMSFSSNDYDRIYGEYKGYSHSFSGALASDQAKLDKRRRECLLGFSEIISGVLGVWLFPSPTGKRILGAVAIDGGKRLWNLYQEVRVEKDIAFYELQRITTSVEAVVDK